MTGRERFTFGKPSATMKGLLRTCLGPIYFKVDAKLISNGCPLPYGESLDRVMSSPFRSGLEAQLCLDCSRQSGLVNVIGVNPINGGAIGRHTDNRFHSFLLGATLHLARPEGAGLVRYNVGFDWSNHPIDEQGRLTNEALIAPSFTIRHPPPFGDV